MDAVAAATDGAVAGAARVDRAVVDHGDRAGAGRVMDAVAAAAHGDHGRGVAGRRADVAAVPRHLVDAVVAGDGRMSSEHHGVVAGRGDLMDAVVASAGDIAADIGPGRAGAARIDVDAVVGADDVGRQGRGRVAHRDVAGVAVRVDAVRLGTRAVAGGGDRRAGGDVRDGHVAGVGRGVDAAGAIGRRTAVDRDVAGGRDAHRAGALQVLGVDAGGVVVRRRDADLGLGVDDDRARPGGRAVDADAFVRVDHQRDAVAGADGDVARAGGDRHVARAGEVAEHAGRIGRPGDDAAGAVARRGDAQAVARLDLHRAVAAAHVERQDARGQIAGADVAAGHDRVVLAQLDEGRRHGHARIGVGVAEVDDAALAGGDRRAVLQRGLGVARAEVGVGDTEDLRGDTPAHQDRGLAGAQGVDVRRDDAEVRRRHAADGGVAPHVDDAGGRHRGRHRDDAGVTAVDGGVAVGLHGHVVAGFSQDADVVGDHVGVPQRDRGVAVVGQRDRHVAAREGVDAVLVDAANGVRRSAVRGGAGDEDAAVAFGRDAVVVADDVDAGRRRIADVDADGADPALHRVDAVAVVAVHVAEVRHVHVVDRGPPRPVTLPPVTLTVTGAPHDTIEEVPVLAAKMPVWPEMLPAGLLTVTEPPPVA